jgi:hypothetical protein
MDPSRFDRLVRSLARSQSRRATLLGLLGGVLAPHWAEDALGKGRRKRKRRGDDRDGDTRFGLAAEGRRRGKGKGKGKGKNKRGRGGQGDGGQIPPPSPGCCGAEACADPEPGGTRSGCDYAGRSFAGRDLHGSTFRGIDGRRANFNGTDNAGSVFAGACLQGATFREADLRGSTWGVACLFGADFARADLAEATTFGDALFCNTRMPDGSRNDRDCGQATSCCQPGTDPAPGPGFEPGPNACQRASDCPDQPCQTKTCANGQCAYAEVYDGPSPNTLCTFCCQNQCCLAPANQCNSAGACCAPNCAGRVCGPDGCGGPGTCGPDCPVTGGQRCNAAGQCVCDEVSCPDGCCESVPSLGPLCWPGDRVQRCGKDGAPCQTCGAGQGCVNQQCAACTPQCAGRQCGPDGCGGQCGECDGLLCDEQTGQCLCAASVCPSGCCSNGPGNPGVCRLNQPNTCGTNGQRCVNCPPPGACNAQGQCVCTPDCAGKTCGSDGCGGSCGSCPAGEICDDPFPGQCACTADSCPTGLQCCPAGDTDRCLAVDGAPCGQSGDCCSGTCCGGTCCADDQTCCGETCCEQGQFCCNGVCCDQPCCGNACCLTGQPCCGGTCCCAPGLGGDCCGDNNDICCDQCGPTYVCCGNGECGLLRGSPCQFPGSFDTECCSTQCGSDSRCT